LPGVHVAGGQGIAAIAVSQALLMSGPELARAAGPAGLEPLGIFLPGPQSWPGGVFDPLGLASTGASAARLKVAEIKHGRLAMVAWLGLAAQAGVGRRGPLADVVAAVGGGDVGKVGL
jgi:light-harvesting complex II chlorophyll a/b binding protein 7